MRLDHLLSKESRFLHAQGRLPVGASLGLVRKRHRWSKVFPPSGRARARRTVLSSVLKEWHLPSPRGTAGTATQWLRRRPHVRGDGPFGPPPTLCLNAPYLRHETTEPSEPNSVLWLRRGASRGSTPDSKSLETSCTDDESTTLPTSQCSTAGACSAADFFAADPSAGQIGRSAKWLLRKEVIQPHLPVRLPCYDLVLIASPTFDSSLPEGLGHRLRVLPTFMT